MTEKVTIKIIAEKCQVSPTTVSLVLNNKPGVSDVTRARVMDVAQNLGYKYALLPSGNKARRLSTVGIVVKTEPDLLPPSNPFYSRIIAGVDDACSDMGVNLLFSMLPVDEHNRPLKIPTIGDDTVINGLILVGTFIDETISALFGKNLSTIILVDGYSDTKSYDMVISDNYGAAYQAVEYLIGLGHRHIGLVGGEPGCYPSIHERRNGYLRALKEHDIHEVYLADFNINQTQGEAETQRLLLENPQITAIFAVNDNVAVGAIKALNEIDLRVPEDVSVMGYDDTYLATTVFPSLTTMRVDKLTMGRAAVHLLALRIEKPDAARSTLVIHPTLVARGSTMARDPLK